MTHTINHRWIKSGRVVTSEVDMGGFPLTTQGAQDLIDGLLGKDKVKVIRVNEIDN